MSEFLVGLLRRDEGETRFFSLSLKYLRVCRSSAFRSVTELRLRFLVACDGSCLDAAWIPVEVFELRYRFGMGSTASLWDLPTDDEVDCGKHDVPSMLSFPTVTGMSTCFLVDSSSRSNVAAVTRGRYR